MAALRRALASGAELVVAPEWFFVLGREPRAFAELMHELQRLTAGSRALVIPGSIAMCDAKGRYRNVVVAFSEGRAVYSYAKRHNGGDQWVGLGLGATAWKPGERSSHFEWRGLRVALEICADHQHGAALIDMLRDSRASVDLQLVVSSGARVEPTALIVAEGGAVVCVDGSPGSPRFEAYRRGEQGLAARVAQRTERCGEVTLHHVGL